MVEAHRGLGRAGAALRGADRFRARQPAARRRQLQSAGAGRSAGVAGLSACRCSSSSTRVLLIGVLLGGIATWFAQGQHRQREAALRRESERLHQRARGRRRIAAPADTRRSSTSTTWRTANSRPMADPLIIKICGIKTPEILDAAIEAGADMVGFMHFPRSPRHVDLDTLAELISQARGRVETCVVLVNPGQHAASWRSRRSVAGLDPAAWARNAASRRGDPRRGRDRHPQGAADRRAPRMSRAVADFADAADRLLLDAKPPKGADRPGGLGVAFDWTLLKALDPALPFMLSGGLTPETVGERGQGRAPVRGRRLVRASKPRPGRRMPG